ncbi:MAG: hypothetical protein ACLTS1_10505 [Coprococcus sp.]
MIGSRRGTSSHQYNPIMILADRENNRRCTVHVMPCPLYTAEDFQAEVEKRPVRAEQNADGAAAGAVFVSSENRREYLSYLETVMTCSKSGWQSFPRICTDVSGTICVREHIKKRYDRY